MSRRAKDRSAAQGKASVEPSVEGAVVKSYEIVLSMRRGTADWIVSVFLTNKDAQGAYGIETVKAMKRGLVKSPTRARLKLPYDDEILRWVRCMLWDGVGTAPYNVAVALERLARELDAARQTSVVDHLVKFMKTVVV